SPIWVLGGKAMLWLSNRDGMRAMAMSGGNQWDAYAMFFTAEAWDRFRLTEEELELLQEAEKKDSEKKDGKGSDKNIATKAAPEPLVLELDRARERKARLTLHSSSMSDALLSADGETLYYL